MTAYFQPLIHQLSSRASEATLSILAISDPALRWFFNQPLGGKDSDTTRLIRYLRRFLRETNINGRSMYAFNETHTYLGSQAAELSLRRRVMHSFGVKADQGRFVATSATISCENDIFPTTRRIPH